MNLLQPEHKAVFVTFYSFKGGVGRTMALVNSACILAGRGRRVLMVDFDLEAPGLTLLTLEQLNCLGEERPPGLVDLIHDFLHNPMDSPLADKEHKDRYTEYVCSLNIPKHLKRLEGGKLDLMPCGRLDAGYEERLYAINFEELFAEGIGQPLFKHLRNLIRDSDLYDYVLIDSRTGFSDEGGICTRDLADHILVFTGLNRQNIDGTVRFLNRLKTSGRQEGSVRFVLSPVPVGYEELRDERIAYARQEIEGKAGFKAAFDLQIPYHPRLALDEEPFIYHWTDTDLFSAYESIQRALRELSEDTSQAWANRAIQAVREGRFDEGREYLRQAQAQDPELTEAALSFITESLMDTVRGLRVNADPFFELLIEIRPEDSDVWGRYGEVLRERGEYERAQNTLVRALEISQEEGNKRKVAVLRLSIGDLYGDQGDYEAALQEYEAGLKSFKELDGKEKIALTHLYIGDLYGLLRGNHDAALKEYDTALKAFEQLENQGGIASVRHSISHVYEHQGNYEKALEEHETVLRILEKTNALPNVAATHCCIGEIYRILGNYDRAMQEFETALQTYRYFGDQRGVSSVQRDMGRLKLLTKDIPAGQEMIRAALDSLTELGRAAPLATAYMYYAESLFYANNAEAALKYLDEQGDFIQRHARIQIGAEAYTLRSRAHLHLGDMTEAAEDIEAALEFYHTHNLQTQAAEDAEVLAQEIKGKMPTEVGGKG